jgi:hypothetical protein
MTRTCLAALLSLLAWAAPPADASPAGADPLDRLVDRADMALWGRSSAGVIAMEVVTASYRRSFTIVSWYDGEGEERTLVKILGPALWRGHGTLKVGRSLKLYNPRSDQVTVVGHSMMGDSWMGSHFSNDDLVKETRLSRHYDKRLVRKWRAAAEGGGEAAFYEVRLTPRPTAPVGWEAILFELWERGDVVVPVRARYFRKASAREPDRTLTFREVKAMGGRTIPTRMEMTLARKPGESTSIVYKEIRFDVPIPASKFTEQALRH